MRKPDQYHRRICTKTIATSFPDPGPVCI